ncbi:hypothetical protein EFJ78_02040 [Pediococcus pentosaceus]|jgi:transposase-like protein|nr:hypothetical protein [Pediococcus pentosaceus]MCS8566940.1 hypothetical protein [Pediococcus pentosaceus]MCS8579803.1 hypothetical protein [Pediococcus pentosaceus]MCT3032565.1 hypothetical protein [Pediococcus pentosaceus]
MGGGHTMSPKKQKAIELMFNAKLSQKDIADEVGVHETTLSKWKHDDDYKEYMEKYARETISRSSGKALGTMIGLLNARSELVRFNAAKDLLDRAGFAPTDKVDLSGNDINIKIGGTDDG